MVITEKQKGILSLIALAGVFASMGLFARTLSTFGFSILQQVYMRIFAATLIGVIVFYKDLHPKKLIKISAKEWAVLWFRAGAFYLFGVSLFSYAIIHAKYSSVSFITSFPLTAVFGFVILKEKITLHKLFFLAVAFVGVVFISVKDYSQILVWGTGEIVALVSTFFFSLSYIARKWHSNILNNKEITQLLLLFAFMLLIITSFFVGEGLPKVTWSPPLLKVIFGAGLFNVTNLLLANYGFQKVDAVSAGNILMLESLFAIILGFIFYQEIPTIIELVGGIVIVVSVFGINKTQKT